MFWWTVGAFFAGVLGANIVGVFVIAAHADLTDPVPFALVFLGQAGGSFALVWLFSARASSGSLAADVGLVLRPSDWWALLAGMGLQIAAALMTYPLVDSLFPDGAPQQGVAGITAGTRTTFEVIVIFLSVAAVAPIIEEIIYRGMLLSWLRRHMGQWAAIIVSAAIFAGLHLVDWNARAAVPGLFLIGVVLGWVALRRGDLSLAIPIHAGVNLLAAIMLVWGDEMAEWAERQLEELDTLNAVVHWIIGLL
ncbi:MAG: CPBP family intramembrane glutamic endopeptidase [Acidimicrobiia bacterium]